MTVVKACLALPACVGITVRVHHLVLDQPYSYNSRSGVSATPSPGDPATSLSSTTETTSPRLRTTQFSRPYREGVCSPLYVSFTSTLLDNTSLSFRSFTCAFMRHHFILLFVHCVHSRDSFERQSKQAPLVGNTLGRQPTSSLETTCAIDASTRDFGSQNASRC